MLKGEAQAVFVDYSPWSEDNGNIDSATVTLMLGNAAISNEALASNQKSFLLTASEAGDSVIEIKGIASEGNIYICQLFVTVKGSVTSDYG